MKASRTIGLVGAQVSMSYLKVSKPAVEMQESEKAHIRTRCDAVPMRYATVIACSLKVA